jgi:release factor glutamine methyltransferase
MTLREARATGYQRLKDTSESPVLDILILLEWVMALPREKILAEPERLLTAGEEAGFLSALARRAEGVPVAWITGVKEFYGRLFRVRDEVLCPRPDTEVLVEAALAWLGTGPEPGTPVLDACTGTGCVGLTLLAEHPLLDLTCTDISPWAKGVFDENNSKLCGGRARFVLTDLVKGLTGPWRLIVSNPPYLTSDETEKRVDDGWLEPALALDGGTDGLFYLEKLIILSKGLLLPGGALMLEAGAFQGEALAALFEKHGYDKITSYKDLAGRHRVTSGIYG